MAKRKAKPEPKEWIVYMTIERSISVIVEAVDEDEARAKAEHWDHVGDEQPGETINWKVDRVVAND